RKQQNGLEKARNHARRRAGRDTSAIDVVLVDHVGLHEVLPACDDVVAWRVVRVVVRECGRDAGDDRADFHRTLVAYDRMTESPVALFGGFRGRGRRRRRRVARVQFQEQTTLPQLPASMRSKPFWKSSMCIWCVSTFCSGKPV